MYQQTFTIDPIATTTLSPTAWDSTTHRIATVQVTNNSNVTITEQTTQTPIAPGIQGAIIALQTGVETVTLQTPEGGAGTATITLFDDVLPPNPGSANSPNVTISGGEVVISGDVNATIVGTPSVDVASGSINIANTPDVVVSGPVTIASGTVDIGNSPSVSITSGIVDVGNTPDINIQSQSITVDTQENQQLLKSQVCNGGTTTTFTVNVPQWVDSLLFLPDSGLCNPSAGTITVQGVTSDNQYLRGSSSLNTESPIACLVGSAVDSQVSVSVNTSGTGGGTLYIVGLHESSLGQIEPLRVSGNGSSSSLVGFGLSPVPIAITDTSATLNSAVVPINNALPIINKNTPASQVRANPSSTSTWTYTGVTLTSTQAIRGFILSASATGELIVAFSPNGTTAPVAAGTVVDVFMAANTVFAYTLEAYGIAKTGNPAIWVFSSSLNSQFVIHYA